MKRTRAWYVWAPPPKPSVAAPFAPAALQRLHHKGPQGADRALERAITGRTGREKNATMYLYQ